MLALIAFAYFFTSVSRTLLFWLAFVLTRPLGATLEEFLTKKRDQGGFDLDTIGPSLILVAVLIVFILVIGRRPGAEGDRPNEVQRR